MGVRHGHPRRFRAALLTAPLTALIAALAVACGSAPGSAGGTGGTRGGGTSGGGTSDGGTGSGGGTGGAASCAYFTQPGYLAMARVVFVGTMLPGRTINGPHGLLVSPARVKVARYIKGSGPAVVTVETAVSPSGDGIGAEGVMARPGQTWRIYTTSGHLPFETGVCSGSRLVGAAAP
jgi:hypothetical protein